MRCRYYLCSALDSGVTLLLLMLVLLSCESGAQDDASTNAVLPGQQQQETPSAKTPAPADTAPAPADTAPADTAITPTDKICRACVCTDDKIDCSNQDIQEFFTKEDWAGLVGRNVSHVDMSYNSRLRHVTNTMQPLDVRVLNLSHCLIDTIDKASFKPLLSLRVLDLSHNNLVTANLKPHVFQGVYSPEGYQPLESMRTLDLSYNKLHSLQQDLFEHIPELTELKLNSNGLGVIDHQTIIAISSLVNLEILELSGCNLTEIPERFLHSPKSLKYLDLSNNLLKTVPQALEETKSLKYLNINRNPIVKIIKNDRDNPGFPDLDALLELHMCFMDRLTHISDEALGGLRNLKILYMNNNMALSSLGTRFLASPDPIGEMYVLPRIIELHMRNSNASVVDRRWLSTWDELDQLDITENPFSCDCNNQWLIDHLVPLIESRNYTRGDMTCASPVEMMGKSLQSLSERHYKMRCLDVYNHRPERDGALLIGAVIGILLAVPIVLSVLLLWRRGYFAWCGVKGPADYSRAFYKRAQTEDFNI